MDTLLEVCCGSLEDVKNACLGGANRVELNSAIYLGGLTPSLGTLIEVKKECDIPVVAMVRPRGGGFCYSEDEYQTMLQDARILLEHGADGLAFGFLTTEKKIDRKRSSAFINLIHAYGKEAVFHKAFDCVQNQEEAIKLLVECGADRLLTSGGQKTAAAGSRQIYELQRKYADYIEILPGGGIRAENVQALLEKTRVTQVHSSCGDLRKDETALGFHVSYGYREGEPEAYEVVSLDKVKEMMQVLYSISSSRENKRL